MEFYGYPKEVEELVKIERYWDACEVCRELGLNDDLIKNEVRREVAEANKACEEGNHQLAIDIYIKTIGICEPANVICRFFQPHLTHLLTRYLIELHKRGFAKEPHTKLLFNLFHHREEREQLSAFISDLRQAKELLDNSKSTKNLNLANSLTSSLVGFWASGSSKKDKKKKDERILNHFRRFVDNFRADAAVETLKENDMAAEAMEISEIVQLPSQIVELLIRSKKDYAGAARIISDKAFEPNNEEGVKMLFDFGPILLKEDESTADTVVALASALWSQGEGSDGQYNAKAFLRLFWDSPVNAKRFLKKAVESRPTPLFVNALIELLIPKPEGTNAKFFGTPQVADKKEALRYIDIVEQFDDIDHLLFVCNETKFIEGTLALLKKKHRNSEIIALLTSEHRTEELRTWVKEITGSGNLNVPGLVGEDWMTILQYFANLGDDEPLDPDFLRCLISNAKASYPLFAIVKQLCNNPKLTFNTVKGVVNEELSSISEELRREEQEHERLTQELAELENEINGLEENYQEFAPVTCSKCGRNLTIPFVGFFCKHMVCESCCAYGPDGQLCCPCQGCRCENEKTYSVPAEKQTPLPQNPGLDLFEETVHLIENGYFSK